MTFDKQTRDAIAAAIERGLTQRMETYEEEWLSADDLCKRLPMFSRDWLRHFGYKLPRERLEVTDNETGETRCSRFMYPLHRIQRGIQERRHKGINVSAAEF